MRSAGASVPEGAGFMSRGRIMTSSINDSVIEYLLGTNYDAISTTAGLAAVFA